jgi:hypothetical protein
MEDNFSIQDWNKKYLSALLKEDKKMNKATLAIINVVKQAVQEGNTSDINLLAKTIESELGMGTAAYTVEDKAQFPETYGMHIMLVGRASGRPITSTTTIIRLANTPKYQQALDSEGSDFTKVSNWWIEAS